MSQTYIPARVIKHNNDVYLTPDLEVGSIQIIPTPGAGGVPDGDFWAVPIADKGIVSGFNFKVTTPDSVTPPDPQAFHVFRLYMVKGTGQDVWYVLGRTTTQGDIDGSPFEPGYVEVALDAECCADDPTLELPTEAPVVVPCTDICNTDANGKYFTVFGLPSRETGRNYYPYGLYNGVALPAAAGTGYATKTTLLNFLNAGAWGAFGLWSYSTNGEALILTLDAGTGDDVFCFSLATINQSA
jgi:hypothetical protein